MSSKTGPLKRLVRRVYATLLTMSVVATAAGCAGIRWVPLAQAPPMGDTVRVKVEAPSGSASTATRKMTLYYPRMEGDSVLVGMPAANDTAMSRTIRVRAASALVGVGHDPSVFAILGAVIASGVLLIAVGLAASPPHL